MTESSPVNVKQKQVNEDQQSKICIVPHNDEEDYDPWKNRNLVHYLGTAGALFHMVKGSLGTGILAMPVSFKNGGLWTSLFCAIFVGAVYTHCAHILASSGNFDYVSCSQTLCRKIKRPRLGYSEIAEEACLMGPYKMRQYSSIAKQSVDVGLFLDYYLGCIVYVLFSAASIKQVLELNVDFTLDIRMYILVVTLGLIPIGLIRNLKYLVPFSVVAIFTLTFGCCFVLYDVFQDLPPISSRPAFTSFQRLPLFFATVIYAIDGIGTVLPIENSMKKPEHMLGCPGVLNMSMVWLVGLYCTMGFFGYLRYGDDTKGSVTLNITSSLMGQVVKLMVTINVICTYGLYLFIPVEVFCRKLEHRCSKINKAHYNYLVRICFVIISGLLAATVPDLELFVGLVGSVCSSTIILFFPPLIELVTFWEEDTHWGIFRWKIYKNCIILLLWLVTLVTGTGGSIIEIINLYQ